MAPESRSRMISFRLTEEEHERFRQLCSSHGIRSVSELARLAMNSYFEKPLRATYEGLESRIAELENRLQGLALELRRVNSQEANNSSFAARRQSSK